MRSAMIADETLSISDAAVFLGNVDGGQAQFAGLLEQLAGEPPILVLDLVDWRERFR